MERQPVCSVIVRKSEEFKKNAGSHYLEERTDQQHNRYTRYVVQSEPSRIVVESRFPKQDPDQEQQE